MTIPPPSEPGAGGDDDLARSAVRRGRASLGELRTFLSEFANDDSWVDSARERVADGVAIPGGGVPSVERPTTDVPSVRPSRRTILAAVGGAAFGAAAASPGRIGAIADDAGLFESGLTVDPTATAGAGHDHVLALVPREDATHRATGNGRWSDAGVWADGEVPPTGARVLIEADAEVTVASRLASRLKTVRVDGTLRFDRGNDSHLQAETIVTAPESLLDAGHPGDPISDGTEARITFADLGPIDEDWDPGRRSKGLLTMGAVTVHGAEKTPWTALARHPERGDRTLELPSAPTNWRLGDRVVVPGNHPTEDRDEEAVVTAVDGGTVELDRLLDHDHVPPAADLDAYALNLSRNVRFDSENADVPRRGHVMFMADEVDVRYAAAVDLGRTDKSYAFTDPIHGDPPEDVPPNPRARYAVHFHETGIEGDDPARIEGVAVQGSPGWGVVNHHSHVDVVDSVTYDVFGSGFVAEAGNERGSFRRNFALRSAGSGHTTDSRKFHGDGDPGRVDDFGHGGHGFWFQGPAVAVEDNVAAGHRHYGFVFWNRPLVDRELRPGEAIHNARGSVPNFPVEHLDGHERLKASDRVANGRISSAYVPIQRFRDNTVFASGGGLEISRHMFGYDHTRYEDYALVEDFTAYDVGPLISSWDDVIGPDQWNAQGGNNGITIRYSHNLRVRGARLLSGTDADRDDATAGVGVNRNTPYPFNVVVEDSVVRGWGRGVTAMTRGTAVVRNTELANRRNVVVEGHDGGQPRRVALEGLSSERGPQLSVGLDALDHLGPGELFGVRNGIELDGRHVYLDAQRPEAVPIPTQDALDALGHRDDLAELTDGDPDGVVGKSNRELEREYGLAVHGAIAPDEAVRDPRVEGGLLGPTGGDSPPREVWLEAEDGDLEEPFRVESDAGASGGEYVVARAVDGHREPPAGGYATYPFEAAAGEYRIHGRVHAPEWSDDSFWVRVDGGPWHEWDGIRSRRGWGWAPVRDSTDNHDGPLSFDLEEGSHRLQLAFREDGTKLDKLLVTALDTTPVWMGEPLAGTDDSAIPEEDS